MKYLHATLAGALSLLTLSALTACDATFHDDLSDCRHTLWVNMAKNDCNLQGTTAPQYVAPAGKVRILAFDKNGLLAADTTWTQNDARPVERVGLHTLQAGIYTILGWAGISEQWEQKMLHLGRTRISDVLLTHKATSNPNNPQSPALLADLSGTHTWLGSNTSFVKFPDPTEVGTTEQEVTLNMHEQTFEVDVQVDVDPATYDGKNDISAHDFDIMVELQQNEYHMDGTPAATSSSLSGYMLKVNTSRTKEQLKGKFTVPALTACNSKVKLTLINRTNGKVVEQGAFDLLALLKLQQSFDPSCARSAKLKFKLKDHCFCGEFTCDEVWVDGLKLGSFTVGK